MTQRLFYSLANKWGLFFFSLLLLFSACEKKSLEKGDKAPDFLLMDIDGKPYSLAEQKGNVVVLEFWATWCGPCKDSIPDLVSLHERYKDKGVAIFGLSVDEDVSSLKTFVEAYSIPYRILYDDKNISRLYKVGSIPSTFVIDKKGRVMGKHSGYLPNMFEILSKEIEVGL
ncbi:MAG: TlpA family protein disulfide reductase [Nitrospirae bacterium]|nr:TlpA family protein disulfide reductase [Nitrospirota bacterium]